MLSGAVAKAIGVDGVLVGEREGADEKEAPRVHAHATLICIEGPQFASRQESLMFRSIQTEPPVSIVNMSAVPEAKLFKEAEMAYALVCMSTDYDSWRGGNDGGGEGEEGDVEHEGVSVEMVLKHMRWNSGNAKRAVEAILKELARDGVEAKVGGLKLRGSSRGGIMGLGSLVGLGREEEVKARGAMERLTWLFGDAWAAGGR